MTALHIVDSHCHIDLDDYAADRAEMLQRARAVGVKTFICIGAVGDLSSARSALALAQREPDVYATVGIHPHDAGNIGETDWQELDVLARAPRVVGIGETGLDYYYEHAPREAQVRAYRRFIALARHTKRPVVSHIRDAHADAADILRSERVFDVGGVIHCFTGDREDARRYLDLGQHLSFSGIVTFKNADELRHVAQHAPADRLLIETDAPYLAPVPYRGKRNEPSFIVKTLETLAELRGVAAEALAETLAENSRRLFGLNGSENAVLGGAV